MYLKALEIQGFKSFPQKTRLTFEKAVTAIVGPNGSGKSNISDALRWVMGEQSTKALRGGKMEDVIFGGTQKRAPVGFAEVSLILDNESGAFDIATPEVMITRRYYRSGESEYYINRQSVRLRDINEMFMDTGLGREGYSIIGQGRIDEILSAKSTDRREIFEEAAGISRFRHRKEESEKKLEKAEENLLRVNDKIAELEMQVEPLREQAETAKKYLLLRDELRGLEISVWLINLEKIKERVQKLEADFVTAKKDLENANAEIDILYRAGEGFSEKMREKDLAAERARDEISAAEAQAAELESAVAVLRANLQNNIESIERINQELKQQEGRDLGLKAQIDERKSRLDDIAQQKEELKGRGEKLSAELEELSLQAGKISSELSELIKNEGENAELLASERENLSSFAASQQELEDRDGALISDINAAEEKLSETKAEAKKNDSVLAEKNEELTSLNNMISGYTMRVQSRRKKADELNDKKVKFTIEQNALTSRISMLTEMEKEYQGYSKSVKTVMQEAARGILKNVYGTVGDLVKTEDKYALAIETALGAAVQNIIVAAEEDGKNAINFLKRRDLGRATFLPLSAVRGKALNENGLGKEDGFYGTAIDLVSFDSKYKEIYMSLLGRVAIVDDMDCAIKIARKYSNRFKIVTLDGQVINAGGSMTGGSTAKGTGILSRANELENLKAKQHKLEEEAKAHEQVLENAQRELTAAEYELSVANDQRRTLEDEILKLESHKSHFDAMLDTLEQNVSALKDEAKTIKTRVETNIKNIADARKNIEKYENAAAKLKADIEEKSGGSQKLTDARQELLDKMAELRAEGASLEAEHEAIDKAMNELSELRRDLSGGREQQLGLAESLNAQNESIKAEISEREKGISEFAAKAENLRAEISQITEQKLELEAERTRRDREVQDKNRALLELERECARLEQKKLAADMEEKQIVDKLWDTYELSRTAAEMQKMELENVPAATKKISELKREISKLGNPNIGAIDEFERVNTRYTYLTEQRDDIDKAKAELNEIIGNITNEMRDIFAKEFERISASFEKTFVELFNGGRASLELEDKNDILNCGIEIKVQPPGKSLKTITLLSGGEKAFVAIALYFAILKVRPTPFVVMDEIEAALDEANVIRFASYLRKLTDKTQFLLITHRRSTMEEADVLYGVTMQEQGVSQILNVDLSEAEKTISK